MNDDVISRWVLSVSEGRRGTGPLMASGECNRKAKWTAGLECANRRVYTYVHVLGGLRRRAQVVTRPLPRGEREVGGTLWRGASTLGVETWVPGFNTDPVFA